MARDYNTLVVALIVAFLLIPVGVVVTLYSCGIIELNSVTMGALLVSAVYGSLFAEIYHDL